MKRYPIPPVTLKTSTYMYDFLEHEKDNNSDAYEEFLTVLQEIWVIIALNYFKEGRDYHDAKKCFNMSINGNPFFLRYDYGIKIPAPTCEQYRKLMRSNKEVSVFNFKL